MNCDIEDKYVKEFMTNGFIVISNFMSSSEVNDMKQAIDELIKTHCTNMNLSIFTSKDEESMQETTKNDYFAESGDKIYGFLEENVVNQKNELTVPLENGLCRLGYALHKLHPFFNSFTFSHKVKQIVKTFTEMIDPYVIQSMILFKNPKVGSAVKPHQDSSFMYAEPPENSLLGFWIALDDATLENGCLHFWPGSHLNKKLYERFIINPDPEGKRFIFQGEKVPDIPKEKSVPVQVKSGDLLLIDGFVIHESTPNTSDKPRCAYSFHIYDASKVYSKQNWLQPTKTGNFMKLF